METTEPQKRLKEVQTWSFKCSSVRTSLEFLVRGIMEHCIVIETINNPSQIVPIHAMEFMLPKSSYACICILHNRNLHYSVLFLKMINFQPSLRTQLSWYLFSSFDATHNCQRWGASWYVAGALLWYQKDRSNCFITQPCFSLDYFSISYIWSSETTERIIDTLLRMMIIPAYNTVDYGDDYWSRYSEFIETESDDAPPTIPVVKSMNDNIKYLDIGYNNPFSWNTWWNQTCFTDTTERKRKLPVPNPNASSPLSSTQFFSSSSTSPQRSMSKSVHSPVVLSKPRKATSPSSASPKITAARPVAEMESPAVPRVSTMISLSQCSSISVSPHQLDAPVAPEAVLCPPSRSPDQLKRTPPITKSLDVPPALLSPGLPTPNIISPSPIPIIEVRLGLLS